MWQLPPATMTATQRTRRRSRCYPLAAPPTPWRTARLHLLLTTQWWRHSQPRWHPPRTSLAETASRLYRSPPRVNRRWSITRAGEGSSRLTWSHCLASRRSTLRLLQLSIRTFWMRLVGSVSISSINGRHRGPTADDLEFTMSAATSRKPTLVELLSHPVCVELLKDELERIHSVENLVFYLHVVRYRQLQNPRARKMVATLIFDTFIAENATQQNKHQHTTTRHHPSTTQAQKHDDTATPLLFREGRTRGRAADGNECNEVVHRSAGVSAVLFGVGWY